MGAEEAADARGDDALVGGQVLPSLGRTEPADRAVDQARVPRRELVGAVTQRPDRAAADGLDEDVGLPSTSSSARAVLDRAERSSANDCLPRFHIRNPGVPRAQSPRFGSIFTTSAPLSASSWPTIGPDIPCEISTTRRPSNTGPNSALVTAPSPG